MQPITLAFAGPGSVTIENVTELLNDWLHFGDLDDDGFFEPSSKYEVNLIFPATNGLLTKGVQAVIEWSAQADLPYVAVTEKDGKANARVTNALKEAEQTHTVANPGAKIANLLADAEGEKFFVILWGAESDESENPDEDTLAILDLVAAADIPVKDLCQGLDDVKVTLEGDEEPQPEPEPEPEPAPEPARRRGARRSAPEPVVEDDEPQVAQDDEDEAEVPDPIAAAKAEGEAFKEVVAEAKAQTAAALVERRERTGYNSLEDELAAEARQLGRVKVSEPVATLSGRVVEQSLLDIVDGTLQAVYAHLRAQDEANAAANLAEVRERPLTTAVREALEALAGAAGATETAEQAPETAQDAPEAQEAAETSRRGRGRPRKDRSQEKVNFLQYDDGTLERKKGRGRTPKEAELVSLTLAEAEAKGWVPEDDAA